jgi:hypothetical protein
LDLFAEKRPVNVPEYAHASYHRKKEVVWVFSTKNIYLLWESNGILTTITKNVLQIVFFDGRYQIKGSKPLSFHQECRTQDFADPESMGHTPYGRWNEFYEDGQLLISKCYAPGKYNFKGLGYTELCGKEIKYNKDGSVSDVIEHPPCDNPCGFFQPYIGKGEFEIVSDVNVRSKPSTDSKSLGLIKKGEKIQVIKDTEYLELLYGNIAPWVEVNFNGKKGYVFGGLLKFLFIPAESIDIENLKKLKFIGKAPESCKDLMFKDPGKEKREKESQEKKR